MGAALKVGGNGGRSGGAGAVPSGRGISAAAISSAAASSSAYMSTSRIGVKYQYRASIDTGQVSIQAYTAHLPQGPSLVLEGLRGLI